MSEVFCHVYLIYTPLTAINGLHFVKIGISDFPYVRLAQLSTSCPHFLKIDSTWAFSSREMARLIESDLHQGFVDERTYGEWFLVNVQAARKRVNAQIFEYISSLYKGDDEKIGQVLHAAGLSTADIQAAKEMSF